jgi:hypothetical protein
MFTSLFLGLVLFFVFIASMDGVDSDLEKFPTVPPTPGGSIERLHHTIELAAGRVSQPQLINVS